MKEKIIAIMMDQLDLERDEIKDTSDFVDDLEMDSLDMMQLVMEIEKITGISVDNDKLASIKNINDLMGVIGE